MAEEEEVMHGERYHDQCLAPACTRMVRSGEEGEGGGRWSGGRCTDNGAEGEGWGQNDGEMSRRSSGGRGVGGGLWERGKMLGGGESFGEGKDCRKNERGEGGKSCCARTRWIGRCGGGPGGTRMQDVNVNVAH